MMTCTTDMSTVLGLKHSDALIKYRTSDKQFHSNKQNNLTAATHKINHSTVLSVIRQAFYNPPPPQLTPYAFFYFIVYVLQSLCVQLYNR